MLCMKTPRTASKTTTTPTAQDEYRADVAAYVAAGGDESVQVDLETFKEFG